MRYGDEENVPKDTRALFEIIQRQGNNLLIDVIAESAGTAAQKFKMNDQDRENLINNLISELKKALLERL